MSLFVLVHGAWHDAWCWDLLVPALVARGHETVSMDLPCDDPSATFADYADTVLEAMPPDPAGQVVLVGHSLAGLTIPLVAARREVDHLVYLCALPPLPGTSFKDQIALEPGMLDLSYSAGLGEVDAAGRRSWVDAEQARNFMYADCSEELVTSAVAHLRPQAQTPYLQRCPLDGYPDVPATYVVCADDQLVIPAWSRRFATERLGADLVELPGSHSPFLSRPGELADVLDAVTRRDTRVPSG